MPITRTPITSETQWHALRRPNVGASEAGALLGVHDYLTPMMLWARKTDKEPAEPESAPMRRGRLLEPVAVEMIREDFPNWSLERPGAYYCDEALRLGATPDLFANDEKHGRGVVQIKAVEPSVFRRNWFVDDELRPPLWIMVQAIVEAHLTDARWASCAAIVVSYGIDLHIVDIPLHAGVVQRVRDEVAHFWHLVDTGRRPPPDYGRDGALIRKLFAKDDGTEIDLSGDNELPAILDRRAQAQSEKSAAEAAVKVCDAMLMDKLGAAVRGTFSGGYISAKTIDRAGYTVKPTSYRQLRIVRDKDEAA